MEMQQRHQQIRSSEPTPPPADDTAAAEAFAACRRLADAADAAIDQAYSGNAEEFLAANRQSGGQ